MSDYLKICEKAARAGGELLAEWTGRLGVREKGPADLVTQADLASQEEIRSVLLGAYPDHGMLGEEGASVDGRNPQFRWIVDPLDGTLNYVHGLPNWCVSIALEESSRIIVGAIYDPLAEECFTAQTGGGAYNNRKPIRASRTEKLSEALVAASFSPRVRRDSPEVARFLNVLERCQGLRRMGSAALNLCYLAMGRLDAYWAANTHLWDVAAGMLIVREAGGIFTDLEGGDFVPDRPRFLAAATGKLHAELLEVMPSD